MTKASISDVAREAGVSVGTVSNALNHPEKVRPETLSKIDSAIEKLGYVPSQAARQLAGAESRVIGLVLPRLDHAFSLQIAHGAQDEGRKRGFDLLIASAGNDEILENRYMSHFLGAHIAGVLAQPMASSAWEAPEEIPALPTVYLDVHGAQGAACIAADNESQGRIMVKHAVSCGAGKIAVVGASRFMQLDYRVKGIAEQASAMGVEAQFIDEGGWNTASDGKEIGARLAKRRFDERPDFIIGLTDVLAAGVIEGIEEVGLKVPGDMLVAGCDGNPLAWSGPVPLTTIESPGFEIGRRGVIALLEQIDGVHGQQDLFEPVATKLLVRKSTLRSSSAMAKSMAPDLNLGEYL